MIRKIICLIIFVIGLYPASSSAGNRSILQQIMNLEPALVSILAENHDVFKPAQRLVRDPKTGRIFLQQKYPAASYERFGAGVIIDRDGVIVTNAHTIHRANLITVTFHNDQKVRARVLGVVNDLDLAFLQVPMPYQVNPVKLADSDKIRLDDEIITVGNSQFLKQTITGGKIRGIGINHTLRKAGGQQTDLIQTTINVYSGDSGGPLFDRQGQLIGLMTASETAQDHSSFAVPSNKIKHYLTQYYQSQNQKP
jgi:S1-C subfamily serine protease